jgi:hypothetical protein
VAKRCVRAVTKLEGGAFWGFTTIPPTSKNVTGCSIRLNFNRWVDTCQLLLPATRYFQGTLDSKSFVKTLFVKYNLKKIQLIRPARAPASGIPKLE